MSSAAELDALLSNVLSQWDYLSTIILIAVASVFIYPIVAGRDPDIHPILLARQATPSAIRQEGESAVYRSTDVPYGGPLRSGLAVKDPGASKWTAGRNGDLRDVWRRAVEGLPQPLNERGMVEQGSALNDPAKIITLHGTDKVVQQDMRQLTLNMNVLGKWLQNKKATEIAVCLSNSAELLVSLFAGSFYGLHITLVPFLHSPEHHLPLLSEVVADTLIAEAGSIPLEDVLAANKGIKRVIWVTSPANSAFDDDDDLPTSLASRVSVSSWTRLMAENTNLGTTDVPPLPEDKAKIGTSPDVSMYWQDKVGRWEVVTYTAKNLIAGTGALQSTLTHTNRLSFMDSVLPLTPLHTSYALCFALLSLFSGSTLLLTSVAGPTINILSAIRTAREKHKPTHIIAASTTIADFQQQLQAMYTHSGISGKINRFFSERSLTQGYLSESKPSFLPTSLSQLKVLFVERADSSTYASTGRIYSSNLANLRLLLGARVCVALTTGKIAGAVCQSNVFDYRDKGDVCNVGTAVASLEVNLRGDEEEMKRQDGVGELEIRGTSAVVEKGHKIRLEQIRARIDADNSITLL